MSHQPLGLGSGSRRLRPSLGSLSGLLARGRSNVSSTGSHGARSRIWLAIRWLAIVAYVVALVRTSVVSGLPVERDQALLWMTLGLVAFSLGTWWRLPRLVIDWLPFAGLLVLYDLLRGQVAIAPYAAHALPQIDFDRALFGGHLPTVWLQQRLYRPGHPGVYDYAIWCVYLTHFFVPWLTAAVLWRVDHARFRRYVSLVVAITFLGYLTYAVYPAAPPWLGSQEGLMEPTYRLVPLMWDQVGVVGARSLFENGNGFINVTAAVPSLHAAYPLLIAFFFWPLARRLRVLLVLYPLAMAFTLVYGAEHFVLDIFVGWAYVLIVLGLERFAWPLLRRQRPRSRRARAPDALPAPAPATQELG